MPVALECYGPTELKRENMLKEKIFPNINSSIHCVSASGIGWLEGACSAS